MKMLGLIDGGAVAARHYFATPTRPARVIPTGFLNLLVRLATQFGCTHVLVAWDSRTSTARRRQLFPEYKQNRVARTQTEDGKKDKERYFEQVATTMALLWAMGIDQSSAPGLEADDLIAFAALHWGAERTVIISTDSDLYQLVGPTTSVCDPFAMRIVTDGNFDNEVGVGIDRYVEFKAMVGDPSDGIPGVPLVGPKTASKWLSASKTAEEVVNAALPPPKAAANLKSGLHIVRRNRALIDLRWVASLGRIPVTRGHLDPVAARTLCEKLWMRDVLETFGTYIGAVSKLIPSDRSVAV